MPIDTTKYLSSILNLKTLPASVMSESKQQNFQSIVILGLKTALLEAEGEINRLKNKLSQVERETLQCYLKCSQTELASMKKVSKLNELKNKLHQELKTVRAELEEQKKEMSDRENENVNLQFKVKELKSLLDIKMELLESLNIKGDKIEKNDINDHGIDCKALLKNLKIMTKNHPRYPNHQVLNDIQKLVCKMEKGKPFDISEYVLRKMKTERKRNVEVVAQEKIKDECCDFGKYSSPDVEILNDSDFSKRISVSSHEKTNDCVRIEIDVDLTAVKENISPLDSRPTSILCQQYSSNEKYLFDEPADFDVKSTPVVVEITETADHYDAPLESKLILSPIDVDPTNVSVMSDSEDDEISEICDDDTKVEPPAEKEFTSSQNGTPNTPSPENHTTAQCMPDLLSESVTSARSESTESRETNLAKHDTNKPSKKLQTMPKLYIDELSPATEDISKPFNKISHEFDSSNTDQSTREILHEMLQLRKRVTAFADLKQFYDRNEIELADNCFKKPYNASRFPRQTGKTSLVVKNSTTSKLNDMSRSINNSTECYKPLSESFELSNQTISTKIEEKDTQFANLPKLNRDEFHEEIENCSAKLKADVVEINKSTEPINTETDSTQSKSAANMANEKIRSLVLVTAPTPICSLNDETNESPVQNNVFKKPDTPFLKIRKRNEHRAKTNIASGSFNDSANSDSSMKIEKTILPPPSKKAQVDEYGENISTVSLVASISEPSRTETQNKLIANLSEKILNTKVEVAVDQPSSDGNVVKKQLESNIRNNRIEIEENHESRLSSDLNNIPREKTSSTGYSTKRDFSLAAEDSRRSLKNSHDDRMKDSKTVPEGADTKKRKAGRPRKTSENTSKTFDILPKVESQIVRVADIKKTVKSIIVPKTVDPIAETLSTMNNGMERRKRKGKFNEILDSLKSKRRRQSDNEIDSCSSLKLHTKDKAPRRGRKKESCETDETSECAETQTNWSPSLNNVETAVEENILKISNQIQFEIDSKPISTDDFKIDIKTKAVSKESTNVDRENDNAFFKTESPIQCGATYQEENDSSTVISTVEKTSNCTDISSMVENSSESSFEIDVETSKETKTETEMVPVEDNNNNSVDIEAESEINNISESEKAVDICLDNESATEIKNDNFSRLTIENESVERSRSELTCNTVNKNQSVAEREESNETWLNSKPPTGSVSPKWKTTKNLSTTTSTGERPMSMEADDTIFDDQGQANEIQEDHSDQDQPVEISSKFIGEIGNRTPPKVREMFEDSSASEIDECENEPCSISRNESVVDEGCKANDDVFGIVAEMVAFKERLLQRHQEFTEFLKLDSNHELPSPSPSNVSQFALNLLLHETSSVYTEVGKVETKGSEEDDDSADEMLVIAEDDQTNDNSPDGIEINKFNYQNVPYCPVVSNRFSASPRTDFISTNMDNVSESDGLEKCDESPKNDANAVKFQFYKENETKCTETVVKELTPFEKVWESIVSTYVPKPPIEEELKLIQCYRPVTHMAFYHNGNRKFSSQRNETIPRFKRIKDLVSKFIDEIGRNEFAAVESFKSSTAFATPTAIATVLMSFTIDQAHREMDKLTVILRALVTLCFEMTNTYNNFLTEIKTVLKNKMFTKTWKLEESNNNGMISSIIALSVFYTRLCMNSKDVTSVRNLLFESLCSLKYRAHPIAYGVLTVWPAIFNEPSGRCLLTQIILFTLINHSMERNVTMFKVTQVRDMIGRYYNIRLGYKAAEDHAMEAMRQFHDETWVDAIVLLCKRQQFSWSYRNVVMKYLLQIVNRWKEHDFNEMILIKTVQALHTVVRCCPMKSTNGAAELSATSEQTEFGAKYQTYNIDLIVNSLHDVLSNSKGSRELHETVAFALGNISHLSFKRCSVILHNWKPAEGVISNETLGKLKACMRDAKMFPHWFQFVAPQKFANEYKTKKNTKVAKTCKDGVFRVGIAQNSHVPMKPKKKKKKKKKNKRKNSEEEKI